MVSKASSAPSKTEQYRFAETWYRCITPVHVGVGQEVGVVDLPIARESTTWYPVLPGSGLRGALRDRFEALQKALYVRAAAGKRDGTGAQKRANPAESPCLLERLFGPEDADEPKAGCVSVIDARILFLPLRASRDVFLWATCPFVLARYEQDRAYFLQGHEAKLEGQKLGDEEYIGEGEEKLWLEEYPFNGIDGDVRWPSPLPAPLTKQRLVLISDAAFSHFSRYATLVRQRNRLTSAKTVADGALFTVEAVPPEAIFYGFVGATRERHPDAKKATPAGPLEPERVLRELRVGLTGNNDEGTGRAVDTEREAGNESSVQQGPPARDRQVAESCEFHLVVGGEESVGMGMSRVLWRFD
jgi:CRISPR-associated protein Cmr4